MSFLRELIYNFLEFISPVAVLVIMIFYQRQWKRIKYFKVLFLYYLCSSVNMGIATWLAFKDQPNVICYNINGFLTLLLLSVFYYFIVVTPAYKRLIIVLAAIGLVSYLMILEGWDDNITFFSAGYSIGSLLIIFFSLLFLKEMFSFSNKKELHLDITIWIVSALLTYFLSAYLIHITFKLATHYALLGIRKSAYFTPGMLWGIHNILYFLSSLFVILTVVRHSRLTKIHGSEI